jgi:hypothetical protein
MALSDVQKAQVIGLLDEFCDARVPIMLRDRIVLQFRFLGSSVVLFEKRPMFDDPTRWIENSVAKFRFDPARRLWRLLCADRYGSWHLFRGVPPTASFGRLLEEVAADRTCVFWG